jgi:electron transfer flavoprotein alpha/beta subunit
MKAKKKPMDVIAAADLGGVPAGRSRITAYRPLPARQAGVICKTTEELARKLVEAKLV